MYHCHVRFNIVGRDSELAERLKSVAPPKNFTFEFTAAEQPDGVNTAAADVVIADLRSTDPESTLGILELMCRDDTQIVVIAENNAVPERFLPRLNRLWAAPMTEGVLLFRFGSLIRELKTQKELQETNHFLDTVINSSPSLIWFKSRDGIHELVNDSFCKAVNKTKAQVQGQTHPYIWDVEEEDPACIRSDNEVMNSRRTCVSEETIRSGNSERLLKTYKSPLYDTDGTVMGTCGVAIDATREREFELEVMNKNNILETVFMTMDCGMICHSLDGKELIRINQAALRILGYSSQEELIADGFDMVAATVVKEDADRLREALKKLHREGDSASSEYRVLHKTGELIHVMGMAKLIAENGELIYQRFLLDFTDRKMREQYEREKNERHHIELIHALSIDYTVICFFDLATGKGMPIRINDSTNQFDSVFMGDLDLETCMNRYTEQFVHPQDKEAFRYAVSTECMDRELSENDMCSTNYRVVYDGVMKYYQMKAVRTGTWAVDKGVVIGLHSVDKEVRSEMEKKTILEKALRQANKANEAKSTFLFNMSHDIRTPMNAILGFTSLALSHIDNTEQVEEYLKKISSSGNLLLGLINDILDMSRIENGKMTLSETLCSIPGIFSELRSIFAEDVRKKHLVLNVDAENIFNEEIYCDRLRLNQVLMNLISNSVKYTNDSGLIDIKIKEKGGAPRGYANYEFRIRDTGIGMSSEFLGHIFEPFERERNSTISGIQGTGLGMAITKKIVDMMKGTIEVNSIYSVGTEVTVKFMFRVRRETNTSYELPEFKNRKALIVCGNADACRSTADMLSQAGMMTCCSDCADEAVILAKGGGFDVCFIDYLLPGSNGIAAASRIRAAVGEDTLIILTAYDFSDIEEEARKAGINGFCAKPLFRSNLEECLQNVLGKNAHNHAARAEENVKKFSGRILLVDDNFLNQEIAAEILKEVGYDVEIASDGKEAVEKVEGSSPGYYTAVLMDVQMPVLNGYEATKQIRSLQNKDLAEIPIFAMTANAFEEDRREALSSGMNGHISKPINTEELFKTLESVSNQK